MGERFNVKGLITLDRKKHFLSTTQTDDTAQIIFFFSELNFNLKHLNLDCIKLLFNTL